MNNKIQVPPLGDKGTKVHFTDHYLLNPTNPITINLIGAGGTTHTGSSCLARMNHALTELNHAGLSVRLWDDDVITEANLVNNFLRKVSWVCISLSHSSTEPTDFSEPIGKPKPKSLNWIVRTKCPIMEVQTSIFLVWIM